MDVLNRAMAEANRLRPNASNSHKCAFANSVAYLVTGGSGGFGGPSIREHLVSWSLGQRQLASVGGQAMTVIIPNPHLPRPGRWGFDEAVKFALPLCFDPPEKFRQKIVLIREHECCYDDDPADKEVV